MKRKEDVEERRQQEAVQRELAQQGHWKLGLPTPSTSLKYHLSNNFSLIFIKKV